MSRPDPATPAGRRRTLPAPPGRRKSLDLLSPEEVIELGYRPNHAQAAEFPHMDEDDTLVPLIQQEIRRRPVLRSYHTGISVKSKKGYPDLTIWGPGPPKVIFKEVKGTRGRISRAQADTVQSMRDVGLVAGFWWPEDYHLDLIQETLDTLAGVTQTKQPRAWKPGHRFCGCPIDAEHTCDTWAPKS